MSGQSSRYRLYEISVDQQSSIDTEAGEFLFGPYKRFAADNHAILQQLFHSVTQTTSTW